MNSTKIFQMSFTALMTAFLCVLAPLSIPIGPVPVSLTPMVICLIVYLIGGLKGTICVALYLIIGIIGLPVFSGFGSGIGKLAGPTGGYIIGFIFTAMICGGALFLGKGKICWYIPGMIVGIIVLYIFGTAWFMISLKTDLKYTLKVCVYPFLPFDAAKIAIVAIVGPIIKKTMRKMSGAEKILRY